MEVGTWPPHKCMLCMYLSLKNINNPIPIILSLLHKFHNCYTYINIYLYLPLQPSTQYDYIYKHRCNHISTIFQFLTYSKHEIEVNYFY